MPSANINKEIQSPNLHPDVRAIVKLLGEIYSNKNLALNCRTISTTGTTLDASDSYVKADADAGVISLILARANSWSSREVEKTTIVFVHNTSLVASLTVTTTGADLLLGSGSVRPGEVRGFISNGVNQWTSLISSRSIPDSGVGISTTLSSATGTFTSASASYSYYKIDNFVTVWVTVNIITNGTAAGEIDANLLFVPAATINAASALRSTGETVTALVRNVAGVGKFRFYRQYDGTTYAGGDGIVLYGTGSFYI